MLRKKEIRKWKKIEEKQNDKEYLKVENRELEKQFIMKSKIIKFAQKYFINQAKEEDEDIDYEKYLIKETSHEHLDYLIYFSYNDQNKFLTKSKTFTKINWSKEKETRSVKVIIIIRRKRQVGIVIIIQSIKYKNIVQIFNL